jgi:excisionase family DNA binding protein
MEGLLTVRQVAAVLNVHGETVRQWLRSGKLRGVKIGHRSWRVPEEALRDLGDTGPAPSDPRTSSDMLDEFLLKAQALRRRLDAAGYKGINTAEVIREVRDARTEQLSGQRKNNAS